MLWIIVIALILLAIFGAIKISLWSLLIILLIVALVGFIFSR